VAVFGLSLAELTKEALIIMLRIGLGLSRRRLDYDLLCEDGSRIERGAVPPDADGLRGLVGRVEAYREPVCAAIESMNGARFVHDRLEELGWRVEIADAQKVKGLARRWRVRPTGSTRGCWPSSRAETWCPRSGCPARRCVASASAQGGDCTWCATARR
jgi:hypothetical protein